MVSSVFSTYSKVFKQDSHVLLEGSAIQVAYTLIKHTSRDIGRYSRMEYQFLDKFSVFQVGRTYLNTTFQT